MKNHADYAENVVPLIPEYGRFDDWLSLLDTPVHEKVIQSVKDQLMADLDAMKMGGQVSLLAKWMPSCNTSSEATKRQARVLYQALGMLELEYRKMLSGLRAYLNVAEVQMSANRWFKIEYSRVTSRANLLYGNAFLKHDGVRRREFLSKLTRGRQRFMRTCCFREILWHSTTEKFSLYVADESAGKERYAGSIVESFAGLCTKRRKHACGT